MTMHAKACAANFATSAFYHVIAKRGPSALLTDVALPVVGARPSPFAQVLAFAVLWMNVHHALHRHRDAWRIHRRLVRLLHVFLRRIIPDVQIGGRHRKPKGVARAASDGLLCFTAAVQEIVIRIVGDVV
jgi:hypothetical protein